MSNSYSPPAKKRPRFFRSLVMLLLFVAGMTSLMIAIFFSQVNLPRTWFAVLADGIVALAAGIGTRLFFYKRSGFTRYFIMPVVLILGLLELGYFTKWKIGVGPLEPWLTGRVNWFDLAQVCGCFLVAVFAMKAWWKRPVATQEAGSNFRIHAPYGQEARSRLSGQTQGYRVSKPKSLHFQLPAGRVSSKKPRERAISSQRSNGRKRALHEPEKIIVSRPVAAKSIRPRRHRPSSHKPDLQISAYEEHRCPYCFDIVKRNDPRGVKECEVCHTLHHADCWEITGACQVPHLNSL